MVWLLVSMSGLIIIPFLFGVNNFLLFLEPFLPCYPLYIMITVNENKGKETVIYLAQFSTFT